MTHLQELPPEAGRELTQGVQGRIVTLDILRGLALFGMILVHFHQKMEKPATGAEDLVGWFVWMGVETKAWATFAILFGAGFAILMRRIESRGLPVIPVFLRRMAALAVIGIIVQLLTGFSILVEYAIWGVVLLFIRNLPTRALVIIAIAASVAAPVITRVAHVESQYSSHAKPVHDAEKKGSLAEAVSARATFARWWYLRPMAIVPDSNLVLFIIGLLAMRLGVFANPRARRKVILGMMAFGATSWVTQWFIVPKLPDSFEWSGIISDQWLAFTYVGAVILLLEYWPQWKARLSLFGIVGRMALTNYVIQAAILSLLACGYGLALTMRPYLEIPATIALFGLCAAFSAMWLARQTYGPLEHLWRTVTYGGQAARPMLRDR
jgi:uncharacterized protein